MLEITRPAAGDAVFAPGELMDCEVEMTVAEGGKLPTGFVFELRRGAVNVTSARANPKERKADGRYVLEGRMACPKVPGRYSLVAHSWDMTRSAKGREATVTSVLSEGVEIRVGGAE